MDYIEEKKLMKAIKNLVKKYGLEGTYEMIDFMAPDEYRYNLKTTFNVLYGLEIKWI